MNESQIVLKLILDGLHQPVEIDSFQKRLMIQKKVYLAQLTGLDLSYRFGWYLRGPYCRELTSDAYRLKEQLDNGEKDYETKSLRVPAKKLLAKATTIWGNRPASISECDWLELLASLHYLKHIAYWPGGTPTDFERIFKGLIDSKPQFRGRKADARRAWDQLDAVGLLANKVLRAA